MKMICCLALFVLLAVSSCRAPKDLMYQDVKNFRMENSSVYMDVKFYNPNNYKIKLKSADVDVFLNGNHLGKMTESKPYTIYKNDTFSLPVMLQADLGNILPNMLQLLFSKEVDIKLDGKIRAGRHGIFITIPVNYSGKQYIATGIKI